MVAFTAFQKVSTDVFSDLFVSWPTYSKGSKKGI